MGVVRENQILQDENYPRTARPPNLIARYEYYKFKTKASFEGLSII